MLSPFAQAQGPNITFTPPADAPLGGLGTIGVLEVTANGNIGNQDEARTSLNSATGTRLPGSLSVLNITEGGSAGRFAGEQPYFSDTDPVGGDNINNISIIYQGTIQIPTTGDYTFDVNSDDGFTLAFDNGTVPFTAVNGQVGTDGPGPLETGIFNYNGNTAGAMQFFGGRGANDSLGTVNLTAGPHRFTLAYHEGGGGANVEFSAAAGLKTAFDSSFALVGAPSRTGNSKLVTVGAWDYVRLNGDADGSNSLAEAITQYNNNAPAGNFARSSEATIAFDDPEGSNTGGKSPIRPFPGNIVGTNEENFGGAGRASFTLTAADAGRYTFLIYADDSSRFRILLGGVPVPIAGTAGGAGVGPVDTNADTVNDAFQTTGCCADALGKYDLAAGTYTLEAIFNEQGGGAGFFVYGAQGDFNSFDPLTFQQAGQNLNESRTEPAGLALVPEPSTLLSIIAGGGMLALRRRRR